MWHIAVVVLMNVLGFVAAAVTLILLSREKGGWRNWLLSQRGQGALSILAAGCLLVVGGQYHVIGIVQRSPVEPELGLPVALIFAVGLLLLAVGAGLLYLSRSRGVADQAIQGSPAVAQRPTVVIVTGALVLALGGLNILQYLIRPTPTASQDAPVSQDAKEITDQEVIKRFFLLFHKHVYADTLFGVVDRSPPKWMGVVTLQNPNDAWIHQEIIFDVKPDFIVETGTGGGGSAILWAMILQQVNPKGRVITIDILDEEYSREAREIPIWKERIEYIKGSSTDPKVVAEVEKRVKGGKVMVILDSAHTKDHVLKEMEAYSLLVSDGSYLIVQDTFCDLPYSPYKEGDAGPLVAVEEFLAKNKLFEPDRKREQFLFSFNLKGYLKRIGRYEGTLNSADGEAITGWVRDREQATVPVQVDVYADDAKLATITADQFREDLRDAGIGDGRHGFSYPTPAQLRDGKARAIQVRVAGTNRTLGELALVAQARDKPAPDDGFHASFDGVDRWTISGWSWDKNRPGHRVQLDIYIDDAKLATITADQFREDLRQAGIGDGRCCFSLPTPPSLRDGKAHAVRVKVAGSDRMIGERGVLLPRADQGAR